MTHPVYSAVNGYRVVGPTGSGDEASILICAPDGFAKRMTYNRYVMECAEGRLLTKDERVMIRDFGQMDDHRPENLVIITRPGWLTSTRRQKAVKRG